MHMAGVNPFVASKSSGRSFPLSGSRITCSKNPQIRIRSLFMLQKYMLSSIQIRVNCINATKICGRLLNKDLLKAFNPGSFAKQVDPILSDVNKKSILGGRQYYLSNVSSLDQVDIIICFEVFHYSGQILTFDCMGFAAHCQLTFPCVRVPPFFGCTTFLAVLYWGLCIYDLEPFTDKVLASVHWYKAGVRICDRAQCLQIDVGRRRISDHVLRTDLSHCGVLVR